MMPQRKPNPPPTAKFAVVLNPGTLFQQVDIYCSTLRDAEDWARDTSSNITGNLHDDF